jgi:hypothetical protein
MKKNNPQPCLTQEELLAYLSHRLSAEEERSMEIHISECELCAEAIEGFEKLDVDSTSAIFKDLELKFHEKPRNTSGLTFIRYWKIAAIFLLLLISAGSYIYISDFNRSTIAETYRKRQLPKTTPQVIMDKEINTIHESKPIENAGSRSKKGNSALDSEKELVHNVEKTDNQIIQNESVKKYDEIASAPVPSQPAPTAASEDADVSFSREQKKLMGLTNKDFISDTALLYIQNGKYQSALDILKNQKSNVENDYYRGICYYNLGNIEKSMQLFDEVINSGRSEYSENAIWLTSKLLLMKGDTTSSENILKQLLKSTIFADSAANALDKLNGK